MGDQFPYNAIEETFLYKGKTHKAIIVPELTPEDDELEFTGNYHCIVIRPDKGTITFNLWVDAHTRWQPEPSGIDPGIIDELDKIIAENRE